MYLGLYDIVGVCRENRANCPYEVSSRGMKMWFLILESLLPPEVLEPSKLDFNCGPVSGVVDGSGPNVEHPQTSGLKLSGN